MKVVYAVMRNADFTEGRGPMVLDSIWDNPEEAIKYAETIEPYGAKLEKGKYSSFAYGQFMEIKIHNVHSDSSSIVKEKEDEDRRKVLAKLTDKEKKLLGIEV